MDRKEAQKIMDICFDSGEECEHCPFKDDAMRCKLIEILYEEPTLSADAVQGVGRYENAMQKLRDMPRYLNGVKEKQITKTSANCTTEKPNDVVEQKNDVVAEPTDLISRADAIEAVENLQTEQWIDSDIDYNNGLESAVAEIKALPSAEQVTGKLNNPCDSLLKADSESCKEQKSKLDLISRADALEQMAQAECGLHYEDCEADNCACDYIWRILNIPSADRPSGEWIPCSEKLPEDGQGVIICTDDKRFKNHPVGTCTYEHGRFRTNFHDDISMIAWMPLPEPYKGGDTE